MIWGIPRETALPYEAIVIMAIVILNALGGLPQLKFIALLVQGIPRSYKLDSQLSYVDVALCGLEQAAVQVAEQVAKIPDLLALEQRLVEAGLV